MADEPQKEKSDAGEQGAGGEERAKTSGSNRPRTNESNNARVASGGGGRSRSPKSPSSKTPKSGRATAKSPGSAKKSAKRGADSTTPAAAADDGGGGTDLGADLRAAIDAFQFPDSLPPGSQAIFLASKTQEIVKCSAEAGDVSRDKPVRLVTKETLIDDMKKRAAVSDFSVVKQQIYDYPEDRLVLIYDADFKFGENFVIALTVDAKNALLVAPAIADGEEGAAAGEDAEPIVYKYVPPVPKDWVSLGSEREVKEESLVTSRNKIRMTAGRTRREFGAPVAFVDRNVGDAKDAYIECAPYEDASYSIKKLELDKGVQAIRTVVETSSQTDYKYPRNANTQYEYREFSEKECSEALKSDRLSVFLRRATPQLEEALQQNEITNPFVDDWRSLADEDSAFGSKASTHLREFQSFTDLLFSKDKTITCIDWHPAVRGLVAVSVAEKLSFDASVDHAHKTIMTPSLILVWSFVDPIHPLLLLEAPDDIHSFRFSPTEPHYVAGGCRNGQVVLWDISAHAERLRQQRSNKQERKKNSLNSLPGYSDDNTMETPVVRYAAVSSIEHSHKAAITDLQWMPDHLEVNRMGVPQENRQLTNVQLITCATDNTVQFWDVRPPKGQQDSKHHGGGGAGAAATAQAGVSATFKHLDLTWRPMLRVHLHKSEPGGDHNPTRFSICEQQGDRSALGRLSDDVGSALKESHSHSHAGGFTTGNAKPSSGKEKRTLSEVRTKFYVGTEDGELVYADWVPQKDQDTGKIQTPKPDFYSSLHDGPIVCLARSPFLRDILLCVGGWTFSIWKEDVNSGPLLTSPTSKRRLTSAHWSPTRPAVFYVARDDGFIDVWDLLERTHEPSINQNVSAQPITCIYPFVVTPKQHLLAVGDNSGTLHVMEIPWSLRHAPATELQGMQSYIDREVKRRHFVVTRWNFREQEKRELEAENKKKMGIAPNVVLTDDERDMRDKAEYQQYLDDETTFLRLLGIAKDEPLPTVA